MGFGFSVRLAPGVRVRASSRGIRTSIGPRAARVHVGAGRTRVSTGAGPFTVTSGVGTRQTSSRGQSTGGAPRITLAQLERQSRLAEREQEIANTAAMEQALTSLHTEEFGPSERVVLAAPPPPSAQLRDQTHRELTKQALAGIGLFKRRARAAARAAAEALTEDLLRRTHLAQIITVQRRQADEDERWAALQVHDPDTVIAEVDEAFADNASDSTCVDAGYTPDTERRYVTTVVLFGTPGMVPDRKPAVTPGGKPTLHSRTKTERNGLYLHALASTVLATVKEALAAAVAADEVNVLVLRRNQDNGVLTPIYLGRFPRAGLSTVDWSAVDLVHLLQSAPEARLVLKGIAREVTDLTVPDQPGIDALVRSFTDPGPTDHG